MSAQRGFSLIEIILVVVLIGGIVAFVGVYWVYRMLEDDLDALSRVTSNDPSAISVP